MSIVKPLEWEHRPETSLLYEGWSTNTIIGMYYVTSLPGYYTWFLDGVTGAVSCDTAEEAQRQAFEHYEAQIRTALVPIAPVDIYTILNQWVKDRRLHVDTASIARKIADHLNGKGTSNG